MSPQYSSAVLTPLVALAYRALQKAVAGVVADHRRTRLPLVVSQNGQVVYVDPESVPLERTDEPPSVHEVK
jgi:hypothetical protein